MTTINKGTTVDTSNLQPGELVHMGFAFYNVTYIRGLTFMITVVCEKTIMIWVFPTAYKRAPICIIRFMTTLLNQQHQLNRVRVDEDSALTKSTDVTNLLVDEFKIHTETTGGDASCFNWKNERHKRSIHNILGAGLLDSNQNEKNGAAQQKNQQRFMDAEYTVL